MLRLSEIVANRRDDLSPVKLAGPRRSRRAIAESIAEVLAQSGPDSMRMVEIHDAVNALRGSAVPCSTIKMALTASRFERVSRGRYRLGRHNVGGVDG